MAISKVTLNGTTLMDATTATAAAADITAPKTAMLANGVVTTGTGSGGGGGADAVLRQIAALGENGLRYASIGEVCFFEKLTTLGLRCLSNLTQTKIIVLPVVKTMSSYYVTDNDFVETIDVGSSITGNFGSWALSGNVSLTKLIIRSTNVISLGNINAFYNTAFESGKAGGTLYVPSALISSYQSATNWSTILGYATNSIQSIEGSIYETQYADGTPIT